MLHAGRAKVGRMILARDVEIKWHAVGDACKMFGLAYRAGFLALAVLNGIPEFKLLAQASPWIPRYVGDSLGFAVAMIMIWRVSHGRYRDYGFALAGRGLRLQLSTALGIALALTWMLLDHSFRIMAGETGQETAYSPTPGNVLGMMSFQWIFVGVLEGPLARGLVQTHLMSELKGVVRIFRWGFHVGTVIAAILFGVGHAVPHFFLGRPWHSLGSELAFATLFGLLAGYVYQETRSLVGPILMHNVVDGLLHTAGLLFR